METTLISGAKAPEVITPSQARRREAESIAANLRNNPLLKEDLMEILNQEAAHMENIKYR